MRAVIRDQAPTSTALLVGHSLGGRVAICAAAAEPALVPWLVLVDAPVRRPGDARPRTLPGRTPTRRTHATLEQAVQTFRLRPREPVADAALLRRVAAAAFAEHEQNGGWSLRADLSVFSQIPDELLADALARTPDRSRSSTAPAARSSARPAGTSSSRRTPAPRRSSRSRATTT